MNSENRSTKEYVVSVIMPIYNVEDYLEEAIDSVIGQTIGFRENIQLILVNDGSPDGCGDICRKYKAEYADNIVYVEKENGGVSSARNAGIEYAKGRYINFTDADDYWDRDAFRLVVEFLSAHEDLNIASAKLLYAGRDEGKPYSMDYVYRKTRIVDITKTKDLPLFGLHKVFFAAGTVRDRRFDTGLAVSEDQLFLMDAVLDEGKFGIVSDAVYYYRKRENETSVFDGARKRADFYTVTPDRSYGPIIRKSIDKYGRVIPYIQSVMLVNMRFRIREVPDGLLTDSEMKEYIRKMHELLGLIDDDTIAGQRKLMFWQRVYLLRAKHYPQSPEDAVIKKLYGILRMQVDSVSLDKDLVISGNAHERWISDSSVIYAEDERGKRCVPDYERCEANDKSGIFREIRLDGYRHSIILPLKKGAVYSFYIGEGADRISMPLKFAKDIKASGKETVILKTDAVTVTAEDNKVRVTRVNSAGSRLKRLIALFMPKKNKKRENKHKEANQADDGKTDKKLRKKTESLIEKEAAKKRKELRLSGMSAEQIIGLRRLPNNGVRLEGVSFEDVRNLIGGAYLPDLSCNRNDYEQFRKRFIDHKGTEKDAGILLLMYVDWLFFCKDRGYDMDDYFDYEFFARDTEERESFAGANFRDNLRKALNRDPAILSNKMGFLKTFAGFIDRSWIDCRSCTAEEFEKFLKDAPVMFIKRLGGSGGDGVARVVTRDADPEELLAGLREKRCIAEKAIVQHPEVAGFNEDSVNTIRTVTLHNSNGDIVIMGAAIRFGRKGSIMDNFHQGGICALIDPETGIITSDAADRNGNRYEVHPDSGKRFRGFRIPEWEEVVRKSIAAAETCKESNRLIGWDLAVTSDNTVDIIEGNSRPGFDILQVPDMTGRRKEFEKYTEGLITPEELYDTDTGYWRKKTIRI